VSVIAGGLQTDARNGPVTAYDAGHRAHPEGDVTEDRALRRAGVSGQVAVEWLMVAGILTAVAIVLTGLLQPVLVSAVRMIARSVRTVGL